MLGLACLILLFTFAAPASAQNGDRIASDVEGQTLVVATKPLPPMVFVDDAALRGFSIDYWNEVSERLGTETQWVEYETVAEIIDAVEAGDADVAIAGISITRDREARIDFSQPYYSSGFQLVTRQGDSGTFRALLSLIGSGTFLVPLLILVALILVVSHLVWLVERHHGSDDFPQSYREGLPEALWWSTVSVITGGEAVKNINRGLSRVIAIFWMLVGLFLLAFVTARATSVLTVSELQSDISTLEDLGGRSVGTVQETSSVTFLDQEGGITAREYATINDALNALNNEEIDAVVFDAPVISYAALDYPDLRVVDALLSRDPYGIAVPQRSDLLEPVNTAVISIGRDGTLDELLEEWFG